MQSAAGVPLIIGVTGHRDLPAEEIPQIRERVRRFLGDIAATSPGTPLVVASQLAEGADLLVADEAAELGHSLLCLLPLPLQDYRAQFSSPEALSRFDALYERSHVVDLSGMSAADADVRSADSRAVRDRQYEFAGKFLAHYCYVLLALWDGRAANGPGGTAAVVQYRLASRGGARPAPQPGRPDLALGEADNSLVYHLPVGRARAGVTAAPPSGEAVEGFVHETASGPSAREAVMSESHRLVLRRTSEFNADIRAHVSRAAMDRIDSDGFRGVTSADSGVAACAKLLHAADDLARHFRKRMQSTLALIYAIGVAMGGAFLLYSKLNVSPFIYVFLVCAFAGLAVSHRAERLGWHRRHLEYRALAEGLRVLFYWRVAGIRDDGQLHTGAESFLRRQDTDLEWIRNVMRAVDLEMLHAGHGNLPGGLAFTIEDWIGALSGADDRESGQLAYFWRASERRERVVHRAERVSHSALWIGLAAAILLAVIPLLHHSELKLPLVMLMGLLPLASGIVEAYLQKSADRELARQYAHMYRLFDEARAQLVAAENPDDKREILRALGRAALAEHSAWVLLNRDRKLRHFSGH